MVALLEGCTEACGWIAAVISVVSFGSFGVPIKYTNGLSVHPLVLQSYKTLVCFTTCWLVVLLGEPVQWTHWGILSGLFWVPGATCGIYGIRNAGLAVAVGTWSSIIVLTSFVFGIIIFQEKVKSLEAAAMAFFLLMLGLVGMSRYSAPQSATVATEKQLPPLEPATTSVALPSVKRVVKRASSLNNAATIEESPNATNMIPLELEPLMSDDSLDSDAEDNTDGTKKLHKDLVVLFGGRLMMTKRQLGVLGAVVNGAWGGMNLIPLHLARRETGMSGASYLISYAGGAFLVNVLLWIILFSYRWYQHRWDVQAALECLPNWHVKELWKPGLFAGLLYSLGNFASIIAVSYLGQGTGFSFCQMQLFVSGLWGVFWFKEIKGSETIFKWFLSAAVAVVGIVWLSYEHEGTGAH